MSKSYLNDTENVLLESYSREEVLLKTLESGSTCLCGRAYNNSERPVFKEKRYEINPPERNSLG
jgi:hypothetical protein